MGVQIFVIITKLNVFVSVTKTVALLFCTHDGRNVDTNNVPWQVHELDVKEIEKDLVDNVAPLLISSKKKGENLMSLWDK